MNADQDIDFYFDPVCPFAWMTSRWVRKVQAQRDYAVDWRFISLQLINATGVAFFGPVISRLPSDDQAVELWDHVVGPAAFPGFAELKRSLRELPQLRAMGVGEDEAGVQQDWHGGSQRLKK